MQLDLFQWSASRGIIDARKIFRQRRNAVLALFYAHVDMTRPVSADVIDFVERRAERGLPPPLPTAGKRERRRYNR